MRTRALYVAGGLVGLVLVSLVMRTGVLEQGYWTDESIAIGIASRPLVDIPATLRLDGSPPLYYLLLHGWMVLFGAGEAATRSLSLVFALAAIPVAFWAGRAAGRDERAGWLAAAAAAGMPFLTAYAQETRMYALVVLLSLVATGCFALALRTGGRTPAAGLAVALVLLLYTHTWAVFLVAALAAAWAWEWRRGRASARRGLTIAGAVALGWAPWLPTLLFQAANTGAPWARVPSPVEAISAPVVLFGAIAGPAILVAVLAALVRDRRLAVASRGPSAAVLLAVALVAGVLAWGVNQVSPAWTGRYLAVTAGPLLIGAAIALRRAPWLPALVAVVGVAWAAWSPPPERSNARALAVALTPQLRAGDAVIATGPQHVPVLAAYLPGGLRWSSAAGDVTDTTVVDWRGLMGRMEATRPSALVRDAIRRLPPGGHVVVVAPFEHRPSQAPMRRLVRVRGMQIAERLDRDPRLERVRETPVTPLEGQRSSLRATVWQRVSPGD